VVLIQSIVIFKKKRGVYILKIITKLYVTRNDDTKNLHSTIQILDDTISFCYKSYNNIGCDDDDDDEEEEVDSDDDMEYILRMLLTI
jgi:hypothetical protein